MIRLTHRDRPRLAPARNGLRFRVHVAATACQLVLGISMETLGSFDGGDCEYSGLQVEFAGGFAAE